MYSGRQSRNNIDQNVYVVIRHAERADCAWDSCLDGAQSSEFTGSQWPSDPSLSTEGIQQAKTAGERLRSDIHMHDLQKVIVTSSPYLRCVQTAAEICRSFGVSSISIDNQIGEIWHPDIVGERGVVRPRTDAENWCKEQGIQIRGNALGSWPLWPEQPRESCTRYARRFLQYLQMSQGKGLSFIFVTHSEGVSSMLRTLPEYKGRRSCGVEYCGGFVAWCTSNVTSPSSINEVWHVKTNGVLIRSPSKESSDATDTSQQRASQKDSGFNFFLRSRIGTIGIISEAVSTGAWPPSAKNTLHEQDFLDPHLESSFYRSFDQVISRETKCTKRRQKFNTCSGAVMTSPQSCSSMQDQKGRSCEAEGNNHSHCQDSGSIHLTKWLRWLQAANEARNRFPRKSSNEAAPMPPINTIEGLVGSGILRRRRSRTFAQHLDRSTFRGALVSVSIADPSFPDCPIVVVSEGFEALTGYKDEEVVGINCRFLNHGCEIDQEARLAMRATAQGGPPCVVVLKNRKKNKEEFLNLLHMSTLNLFDKAYILGVQADVTHLDFSPGDHAHAAELHAYLDTLFASNLVPWAQQKLM